MPRKISEYSLRPIRGCLTRWEGQFGRGTATTGSKQRLQSPWSNRFFENNDHSAHSYHGTKYARYRAAFHGTWKIQIFAHLNLQGVWNLEFGRYRVYLIEFYSVSSLSEKIENLYKNLESYILRKYIVGVYCYRLSLKYIYQTKD